ncbi:hypothetical protein HYZ78_02310, partial [Candidatus Microgenomates bacterium]|nr:hypothetical protein [Candidatus Microgenomates bacterium]
FSGEVFAKTEEELRTEIAELEKKVAEVSGQAKTLSGQITNFNNQIKLTELKISQTEDQIATLSGKIDKLEGSIVELSNAHQERVSESYRLSRIGDTPLVFLLASRDLSTLFSRVQYLQMVQDRDRDLLLRLQNSQTTLEQEKLEFEELSKKLEGQKGFLANQRGAKENLLTVTKNDEKKYQQLLSQARAQLAAFRRFVTSQGGATILSNQTKCDSWGCYYNQRDSQWGTMALGSSSYSVAEYGCLVSSVSMLASHSGKNIKPNDISAVAEAFVPSTGYMYHSFSVNGVSISVTAVSKSQLDAELAAGRPVIAGLYGGPDHFIVILKKEGDKYVMHDPFLENGSNRPLTDKYNFSDISSLRLVQFN